MKTSAMSSGRFYRISFKSSGNSMYRRYRRIELSAGTLRTPLELEKHNARKEEQ